MDTNAKIATARILQIEPLQGPEAEQAELMLRQAMERRTGKKAIQGMDDLLRTGAGVHLVDGMSVDITTGEVGDE